MQSEAEALPTHHVDPATNINYPVMPDTGIKYVEQSVVADIDEILDMYEYAEKLHPYSKLRLPFDVGPLLLLLAQPSRSSSPGYGSGLHDLS